MDFWQQIVELLEHSFLNVSLGRLAVSIGVLMASLLLRQMFSKYSVRFLTSLAAKTETTLDDHLLHVILPPGRLLIAIAGVWASIALLRLPEDAQLLVSRLVRSLVAGVVIWALYRAADPVADVLEKTAHRTKSDVDDLIVQFIRKSIKVAVVSLGSVVIVQEWGYDVAGLLAGLGLGGLALALAAQDTAANLFGGITIMLDRPFAIGDWIYTPHVEGTVEEIGFRSTRVRTFAQALVTVPNRTMASDPITNWTRMGKRRITYRLGVTHSTGPDQLDECCSRIREMLSSHEGVHPQTIFVYFESFGESALEIFIYFFTKTTMWNEFLEVQHDANLRIMRILEEMGIQIALPSRSIYMQNESAGSTRTVTGGSD